MTKLLCALSTNGLIVNKCLNRRTASLYSSRLCWKLGWGQTKCL